MSTINILVPGYSVSEQKLAKTGDKDSVKLWMIREGRLSVRENGDSVLSNIHSFEYEFVGQVISELAINDTLILIVDVNGLHFYIENGRMPEGNQLAYSGKFVKGKGQLTLGEYPYSMGVEATEVVVKEITKVNMSEKHLQQEGTSTLIPVHLSPQEYSTADTEAITQLPKQNEEMAFFIATLQQA